MVTFLSIGAISVFDLEGLYIFNLNKPVGGYLPQWHS